MKEARLTLRYSLVQGSYWMTGCCVMTFATVFLLSRGFTNTQVGLTLSLAGGLSILMQPFLAAFADKTKKLSLNSIIALTLAGSLLITGLLFLTPNLLIPTAVLFLVLQCFQNIQQALITSLAMGHINSQGNLNFSLARGIGSLVFACLSFSMGFLVDSFGGGIVLPVNLAAISLCLIFVLCFPQPKPVPQHTQVQASNFKSFVRQNQRFMLVVLSMVLVLFSHVLINTYTIQIIEDLGGTSKDMGIATAVAGWIELPAMAAFPFLLRKFKSAGLLLKLAALFMVIKTLATILAPTVMWFYFAQCFQLLSFAMYIPASVYFVNRIVKPGDKVKGQTYMGLAMSVSGMLGSLCGGLLIDAFGVKASLSAGLAVSVVGLICLVLVAPKDKAEG